MSHYYKKNKNNGSSFYTSATLNKDNDDKSSQLRYVPIKVVNRFMGIAEKVDPPFYNALVLMRYMALRKGECVNVRSIDSPLGPGYIPETESPKSLTVILDKEYLLRDDKKVTGRIKKEKNRMIDESMINRHPSIFKDLQNAENILKLKGTQLDSSRPLFINKNIDRKHGGVYRGMTTKQFTYRFNALVQNYLIPAIRKDGDNEENFWADQVGTLRLNPHVMRHIATIECAMYHPDPVYIKLFRGDSSTESAEEYLSHMEAFKKAFGTINEASFEEIVKHVSKHMGMNV